MAIGGDGQTRESAILASQSGASVPARNKRLGYVIARRDLLTQLRLVS
jgi:hypothetical protein